MRVGYFAMPLHPPGSDPAKTMDDDLLQLATLDRLGYEEAWIGEHFTAQWENIPCPDLFIARALERTKTMKLATGVSCLPNHDPLMLAQRIAQLDQMARGRFYWGVGAGGFPGDFELFGVDPKSGEHRVITREILDTVLSLWQDAKPGGYDGRRFRFTVPHRSPTSACACTCSRSRSRIRRSASPACRRTRRRSCSPASAATSRCRSTSCPRAFSPRTGRA